MGLLALVFALAAPTPTAAERAKTLAIEAYARLQAGDFPGAIAGFKASSSVAWRRSNDCNIGTAYVGLKLPHRAWFFLDRCRRRWARGDAPGGGAKPFPAPLTDQIAALEGGLLAAGHRRIELVSAPPGAALRLHAFADDEPMTAPVTLFVPAGRLVLRATLDGRTPVEISHRVGPGTPTRVRVELPVQPGTSEQRLAAIEQLARTDPAAARSRWEALLLERPEVGRGLEARLLAAELLVRAGRADEAATELVGASSAGPAARWLLADRARLALRAAEVRRDIGQAPAALDDARAGHTYARQAGDAALVKRAEALTAELRRAHLVSVRLACRGVQARARFEGVEGDRGCDERVDDLAAGDLVGAILVEGQTLTFRAAVVAGRSLVVVEPETESDLWPWILAGGAGVAAVSALGLGLAVRSVDGELGGEGDRAEYDRLIERREGLAVAYYTSLAGAVVLGGAAAWWLLGDEAAPVRVTVTPEAAGASWRHAF